VLHTAFYAESEEEKIAFCRIQWWIAKLLEYDAVSNKDMLLGVRIRQYVCRSAHL
jgi:hypothetical protein